MPTHWLPCRGATTPTSTEEDGGEIKNSTVHFSSQPTEGQIIVLQAADPVQTRKMIPDYATWSQCNALYVAVLAAQQPGRLADLMGYQSLIACVSKEVQVAILGDIRPEFQAGGSWKSRSAVGEGRAQPVYAVLH